MSQVMADQVAVKPQGWPLINLKAVLALVLSLSAVTVAGIVCAEPVRNARAKNVVLFIGDGMGAEHVKAASWLAAGEPGRLTMDAMATSGRISTRSLDNPVTDSAASATAMASGVITNNGVIGLDEWLEPVPTILETAMAAGKSVGLVTTSQMTHATPAAFAAHVEHRRMVTEIAGQMLLARPDVMLGGGEDEFLPSQETGCYPEPGERKDGRNLLAEAVANGYLYVCDNKSFDAVDPDETPRLLGLFSDEGMTRPFSPSLAEMTGKAIEILSNNKRGFFLMVESAQIDWASHDNDAEQAISDTLGLDEAVAVAMEFAGQAGETLVIVTADHETGGMRATLASSGKPDEDGPFLMPNGDRFYVNWSTTGHTSLDVPVAAHGPSSARLTGLNDNTHVHDVMSSALLGK
jgi:alkaline phosphatase